ncbi:MAG: chemotaxis protein CheW, partial [Marinobacter sp.]|nr:chemotaxis protein CheW [Marinobacter sp.]
MADGKLTRLAAPEAAIASYLDELLHTATDTALREETTAPEPVKPVASEPPVETRPQVQTTPAPVETDEKPAARP